MEKRVSEESTPSMKLCLGIGADDHDDDGDQDHGVHVFPQFTEAQLHELKQQALIFKYIVAGLPVPLDLIVPIWNSVASSSLASFTAADFYRQFPSFVGLSPQGFDYRHLMDPEPGRCRRTDGKKWRCSKDVVPGQKYCERHMHRGRQRSRKPVEASSQTAAASDKKSTHNSENPNTNSSNLTEACPQVKTSSFDGTALIPSTTSNNVGIKMTGMSLTTTANADHKHNLVPMTSHIVTGYKNTSASMIISSDTIATGNNNLKRNYIDDGDSSCSNTVSCEINGRSSSSKKINNIGSNVSQGLDFSPKSVLQVPVCSASRMYISDVELEPGRCRRTDGKKWRCRRDVVMNQKYCEMHMHRGSKKHMEASQPAVIPDVSSNPTENLTNKADRRNLNTDLSISIPTSARLIMTNDDTSTTSNSSDTTISDTNIGANQNRNFS